MNVRNSLKHLGFWLLSGFCFIYVIRSGIFIQLLKTNENRYLLGIENGENNTEIIFSPYGIFHPLGISLILMALVSIGTFFLSNSEFFKKSLWVFVASSAILGVAISIGEMVA